jgi:hypothetical protein
MTPAGATPRFTREEQLDALIDAFERAEPPPGGFDHAAHLAVAFAYLERHPVEDAVDRVRQGLLHFLRRQLGDDTAAQVRYRETVTVAWMRLVAAARAGQDPSLPRLVRLQQVLDLLGGPATLRRYYSEARLDDPEARARFLEPDLRPLPTPEGPA